MKKYFLVFTLALTRIFEYRFDFFLHAVKYAVMVILMALIWLVVGRDSGELPLNQSQTVTYFFFAAMIYTLSNFHPYYIEEDILHGNLARSLVKPIKPFIYYFFFELGVVFFETALKILIIPAILLLLGYQITLSIPRLALVITFLPLIFIYAYNQFGIISGLAFWISEAWSVRWSLTISIRFLSGILVPVSFFPLWLQTLSFWLPFQHLAYTPISIIQGTLDLSVGITAWLVLASWTVVVILLRQWRWQRGYIRFESTGQ